MGKSSKPKQEVNEYGMSIHYGICAGPAILRGIIVKEKPVVSNIYMTGVSSMFVSQTELFGGPKKEGGVAGTINFLAGAATQVLPDSLAQKLGRADGADAPGYRGIASIFMTGEGYSRLTGFYWGANVPYLPGTWAKMQRLESTSDPWYPEKASVGTQETGFVGGKTFGVPQNSASNLTISLTDLTGGSDTQPAAGDIVIIGYTIGHGTVDVQVVGYTEVADLLASDDYNLNFGVFYKVMGDTPDTSFDVARVNDTNRPSQVTVHVWRGIDPDDPLDAASTTATGANVGRPNPPSITPVSPGAIVVCVGSAIWTTIGSLTQPGSELSHFIGITDGGAPGDTAAAMGSYVWSSGAFDPVQWTGGSSSTGACWAAVTMALKPPTVSGDLDMNPAHIIHQCLVDTDWGMGSPLGLLDDTSFRDVADTLYDEGFGLSMIWTRQAAIQDFIQEVLDHIQGVLFVDPATGLLTLKLIRGDYDPDYLDTLTPDNADLTSFSRKLWGEIVNEIIVTWTNPVNEEEETVVAQDLASIVTQGGIVSDSRNYYGVRNSTLAGQLAQRDLRSSGAPLATCEVEADRRFWSLRPASVIKVTWPEHGLSEIVFRVTNIDYGRPGDPTIKLSLVEDVFGLDVGEYVEPATGLWEDPASEPEPLEVERVITLPLFFAADTTVDITDAGYPEVLAGILGTTSNADTFNYDLWSEVTLPDASTEWQSIGTNNILGYAELTADLDAEALSTAVGFSNLIGQTAPAQGGFVLIGDTGDDETEMEIAMVTDPDAVDLTRGVLDTVPRAWPAGTHVWFVDGSTLFEDPIVRSAGETAEYKLLTRTSLGLLDIDDAALVTYTLTERPWLPNRPADVQVDGVLFNDVTTPVDMSDTPDPWVTVEWANRNRITEDSLVLAWTDATVAPEDGQTTKIEVYAEDGTTLLDTHDGLSGTDFDVPDSSFGSETVVLLKVWAERSDDDGDFTSLQAHGIWVRVGTSERVTEAGERRVTEDGDVRVTED